MQAQYLPVDYLALSPTFATPTKTNITNQWGLKGLTKAVQLSSLPMVAIGGINMTNIHAVIASQVNGVALVSAICHAPCPQKAARNFKNLITQCALLA